MTTDEKLEMVRTALAALVAAVGAMQLQQCSQAAIAAYQKAAGTLDALAFVERLKEAK